MRLYLLAGLALSLGSSCAPTADEGVVARVDTVEIRFADLLQFKEGLPALLLSEKEGVEALREYLQTMIDMELLVLEARARGLDREPGFSQRLEEEQDRKLVAEFLRREIQDRIELPQDALRQRWEESKWSRMLKLAHIRVSSEAEAWEALGELERGQAFEEVARRRSIHPDTAPRGGALEPFFGRGNLEELGLTLDVAEDVFSLQEGQISEPLEMLGGYEIFKVVDVRPAPASYYLVFSQGAMLEAYQARRRALIAELESQFEVHLVPEGVALLVQKGSLTDSLHLSERESQTVLARYQGGEVLVSDFARIYPQVRALSSVEADSSGLVRFVRQFLLPEFLFKAAIERSRLAEDETVMAWMRAKEREMLIDALKEGDVDRQIDLSEASLLRYYENNLERFMQDEEIQVQEVLVETREEAMKILERIRKGEDMGELAAHHSIRQGAAAAQGQFHLHPFDRARYGALLDAALKAGIGQIQGPVELAASHLGQAGFSVFKVVEKIPAAPKPFARVERQVRYWWKKEEETRLFGELIDRLREKYAGRIVLFEDRLMAMHVESSS